VLATVPRVAGNPHVIVGGKEGAALVNLEKPWRKIRDRVTVGLWRDSENAKVSRLVVRIGRELDREPSATECRAAACKAEIELPAGATDVRLHDLRHAFASVTAASGMGLQIIGKMLGHTQATTTARNAHLSPDPVKAAAQPSPIRLCRP
jgi:integrase